MNEAVYAKTDKIVNRLGFGSWQLNNPLWGDMSETEAIKLVRYAIEQGINLFDTAPAYGSGQSEVILGQAIQGQREHVVINTKVGHLADGTSDFSVSSLENQIQVSLKRLNTDYIDSVILHNPDRTILAGKTMHFDKLKQLKSQGFIRAYGVSIDTYEDLMLVLQNVDLDVIEILFNVFFQGPAQGFQLASLKNVSLIVKVPLDSGWLTGKYNHHSQFTGIRARWSPAVIKRRADLVDEVKTISKTEALVPIALGFILSYPEITAVIPGIKDESQLQSILECEHTISDEIKNQLIKLYDDKLKTNPLPW
ncbi:aldo/keto reductase [Acholeplasma vituli]|uniref:Aldo/keto reductase n=1 Tax=Paracholeplasma vituli TaxID=69473 RepID=A0ABT2PWI9_9MOLU|nr:aldo/keto reductase [Paracholeplasma vituli]MCU0105325.1 aldo/keto reductase [Paracholeplasma vituli]